MNTNYVNTLYKFSLLCLISLFVLSACSSDNSINQDEVTAEKGGFSVNIDGELWEADNAYIITAYNPYDDELDWVDIKIVGQRFFGNEKDDTNGSEMITISLVIEEDLFESIKGTYPMMMLGTGDSDPINFGHTGAALGQSRNALKSYRSFSSEKKDQKVGEIIITDFEIGSQGLGTKGYTNLTGSFNTELNYYNKDGELTEKIKLTDGKFNLSPLFN